MHTRRLILKNAAANLARGGAVAAFSLLLPPFLVRRMDTTSYAIWVLVLQVTAYISFLDLGLQTAVGRYVAYAEERRDAAQRDAVYSTALFGLGLGCLLGGVLLLVLVPALPLIITSVPADWLPTMRWTMLIIGLSVAAGLPASAFNGAFIGLQRHEIPAVTIGGARVAAAVGIVVAVLAHASLVTMALVMAAANMAAYTGQYVAMRRVAPGIRFRRTAIDRRTAHELFHYCFALTVMSFSMLLVNGLDLTLVGRFQFAAVIPYSVVSSLIPVIAGSLYAILNALLPHAARLQAQRDPRALGEVVIRSTQMSVFLLVFSGAPAIIYAGPILHVWIGHAFTHLGQRILMALVVANMVRLIGAGYATVLIATGQQRLIKISPVVEGVTNLVASVLLGARLGAIGVALGTLVGAVFGIGAHLVYSMPRTYAEVRFARRDYLWQGILQPWLCTAPLLGLAGAAAAGYLVPGRLFALALALSLALSLSLVYRTRLFGGGLHAFLPHRS